MTEHLFQIGSCDGGNIVMYLIYTDEPGGLYRVRGVHVTNAGSINVRLTLKRPSGEIEDQTIYQPNGGVPEIRRFNGMYMTTDPEYPEDMACPYTTRVEAPAS